MSDYRQQQEQDDLQSFLWHSLNNLIPYISAELFEQAAKQIGMGEIKKGEKWKSTKK